jgi:hypothetical protein
MENKEEKMKHRKPFLTGVLVLAVASLVVSTSFAQGAAQQQQQQAQQQQMIRMQNLTQKMDQIMERTRNMVRNLEQKMANLPENAKLAQEQHRYVHQLGEAAGKMAEELKGNVEKIQEMVQNRELFQNREMLQDMNRVQNRLENISGELEEMVKVMERLTNRLRDGV